jgi:hypothetical protein
MGAGRIRDRHHSRSRGNRAAGSPSPRENLYPPGHMMPNQLTKFDTICSIRSNSPHNFGFEITQVNRCEDKHHGMQQ